MVLKYIFLCSLIPDDGGPPKHVESLMNTSPVVHCVGILEYYTFVHCHIMLQNYRPFYVCRICPQRFTMSECLLFLASKQYFTCNLQECLYSIFTLIYTILSPIIHYTTLPIATACGYFCTSYMLLR
jgi:hypothetical protein